jgi:hypothetical protein
MKSGRKLYTPRPVSGSDFAPDELALRALAYLTRDDERLGRFLALTGVDAGDVRGLLGDRGFHLAVLDHLAGDEALLLDFAAAETLRPEALGRARRALGGDDA